MKRRTLLGRVIKASVFAALPAVVVAKPLSPPRRGSWSTDHNLRRGLDGQLHWVPA